MQDLAAGHNMYGAQQVKWDTPPLIRCYSFSWQTDLRFKRLHADRTLLTISTSLGRQHVVQVAGQTWWYCPPWLRRR